MRRYRSPQYYEFIPVDGTRRVAVSKEIFTSRGRFDRITLLNLSLKAESDIHVGSGTKSIERIGGRLIPILKALRNGSGMLYIPGSALKGVVSTNYLALSGFIEDVSECFGTSQARSGYYGPLASKLFFSDAIPESSVEPVYREVQRARRPTIPKPKHVKIYTSQAPPTTPYGKMECIPRGTLLKTKIVGLNLRDYELGGILMALGLAPADGRMEAGSLKVGYGKPQGFGKIQVDPDRSTLDERKLDMIILKGIGANKLSSSRCARLIEAFINQVERRGRKEIHAYWFKIFRTWA
jgi:CRISPR/Cas system CSM-associated protein Csm3 (group 7 of RAMP superfamily)